MDSSLSLRTTFALLGGLIFLTARLTCAANETYASLLSRKDMNPLFLQPRWLESETAAEYESGDYEDPKEQQQQPQMWFDKVAAVEKRSNAPRNPYSWMAGESSAGLRGYFDQKRAPAVRNPYSWMVAAGSSSANAQLDQMARFLKRKRAAIRNPYSWMAPADGMADEGGRLKSLRDDDHIRGKKFFPSSGAQKQ